MTSARESTARLADLLRRERAALAEFLVAVADFDERRLWLELGHSSLFYFLHRELGLSKGAAFYRKTAAELIRRFPEIVEPLRDGRLCLTSVVELSKVMTPENRDDVMPRFFQLSKREAKAVSAALKPDEAAPHRDVVTAVRAPIAALALDLPGKAGRESSLGEPGGSSGQPGRADRENEEPLTLPSPRSAGRGECGWRGERETATAAPPSRPRAASFETEPLTAGLSRLHATVSRRFLEKLEAARAALSHSHPGASAQEILEAGLDLLVERHAKRRGLATKPRREAPPSKPGHVPAHVKRAVWKRDGGRCQWKLDGGGVCGSTHRVELDHVVPKGLGGPATIENTRLLCRVHNQYAARQVYGDELMDRFTRKNAAAGAEGPAGP